MRLIILAALAIASCCNSMAQKPTLFLKATVGGLKAGQKIYIQCFGKNVTDSVTAYKNGFRYSATVAPGEGDLYQLRIPSLPYGANNFMILFLDRGKTVLKAKGPLFRDVTISGNQFADDFDDYRSFTNVQGISDTLFLSSQTAGGMQNQGDTAIRRQLEEKYNLIEALRLQRTLEWVKSHSSSPVAGAVLYLTSDRDRPEEMEKLLNSLGAAAQNNKAVERYRAYLEIEKLTGVGKPAPEFTQADTAGVLVSLKDFRGKFVLIDFWASWCHPCRAENKHVLRTFNRYSNRNFTVLGVSLDRKDQKDRWLKAIHDDGLRWTQVSDLNFWENAVAKLYNVSGIPANVLVDPDGKIVARNLYGHKLEEKVKELLGASE